MSIKNAIMTEIKSIADDLRAAENLEPTMLIVTSGYQAATTKETFKDRIVDNATKGYQASERLGDRLYRLGTLGGLVRLWTKPTIPSVVIREPLPQSEATPRARASGPLNPSPFFCLC